MISDYDIWQKVAFPTLSTKSEISQLHLFKLLDKLILQLDFILKLNPSNFRLKN